VAPGKPYIENLAPLRPAAWAFFFLLAAVLAPGALGKECSECHSGQEQNAAVVKLTDSAAHTKLECAECHAGLKTNESARADGKKVHGDKPRSVQCKSCHADESKALSDSSHAEKLKQFFEQKGVTRPAAVCQACHSGDMHALPAAKDPKAPSQRSHIAATCLVCHTENQAIAVGDYSASVHGRAVAAGEAKAAVCTDCHGSHAINHSRLPNSKAFHATVPETCGQCHKEETKEYTASIHWAAAKKGFRESPVCTDCHGEHAIRSRLDPLSSTFATNVTKTCAACHASERITAKFSLKLDRAQSFRLSFHGLFGGLGDMRAANCASCHGNHEILPTDDPRSSVNPENLGRTCGHCHPGAERRFINERVHVTAEAPSHWSVTLVRAIYGWLIFLTIGGMLLHNLFDLKYKSMTGMPYHRQSVLTPRFTVNERMQHALLALSFIFLAVSGFALRFPQSFLSWPFELFAAASDVRRLVHRVCAAVFVLLAVYHVAYLFLSARGRGQFKALLPVPQDLRDARNVLLKYVGHREVPLQLPHYAYTEKMEYWALVWGGTVMTATGLVLFFVNLSLSALPLWAVDLARTIHYWEAVLAGLAILVWHGYWIVLDPEIYPMNLTWLIGNPRPATAKFGVHALAHAAGQKPPADSDVAPTEK